MIVVFKECAFRHGFDAKDFYEVQRNPCRVFRSRRGHPNVYEILGRTDAGEYLHVITRRRRSGPEMIVIVFHMDLMNPSDRKRYREAV